MDTDARNSLPAPEILPGLPQYVDLTVASRATGYSPVTLRAWERVGRIRGYRGGGRLRFRVDDLVALIEAPAPRRTPPPEFLQNSGRYRRRRRRAA